MCALPATAPMATAVGEEKPRNVSLLRDTRDLFGRCVRTKIELRDLHQMRMTPELATRLLGHFRQMPGGAQAVKFTDFPEDCTAFIEELRMAMSPKLLYTKAVAWRMLSTARAMKARADQCVDRQEYARAMNKYSYIHLVWDNCLLSKLPFNHYGTDYDIPIIRLAHIMLDSTISAGFLAIRYSNLDHAGMMDRAVTRILRHLHSTGDGELAVASEIQCCRNVVWYKAIYCAVAHRSKAQLTSSLQAMRGIRSAMHGAMGFTHDLAFLEDLLKDKKVMSLGHHARVQY